MSETLTDTTEHDVTTHDVTAHGADGTLTGHDPHGRHRGVTAPDDRPDADPHGRHRR